MADKYALIRNNVVENVTEWDGGNQWSPPEGVLAVRLDLRRTDHRLCGPGHTYDGNNFTAPAPRVPQEPEGFAFTPREFIEALLDAMVKENTLTPAKATAIATRVRNTLKR